MTTALAIYAALVSTSAIAWQIVSWRLARRTLLKVHVSRHTLTREDDSGAESLIEDNLVVSVINVSEHPVRVAKARLANKMIIDRPLGVEMLFAATPDAKGISPGALDLGDKLARVIEARDSVEALVSTKSLGRAGIQVGLPFQVYVLTATDDWFSSDPVAYPGDEGAAAPTVVDEPVRVRPRRGSRVVPRPEGKRTKPKRPRLPPPTA